ncbi:two-component response regulator 24-like [Quercus robur]|uniref:two-component response regulator 24-like n=1 Tax=Quercus robur TaxID=38942 RepID=UPI002161EABB|nr:two-component response regulator 24-like [Quercus robur]
MGAEVDHICPTGMSGGSAEGNDKSEGFRLRPPKCLGRPYHNGGVCQIIQTGLLRSYGVETEVVETGEAVVELIASGATFNLIIIEMLLPILNGPETVRQIRAMGAQGKILGITTFFDERDQQEFLAAGADEFIEKPLSPEIVIPIIRGLDN